MPHQLKHVLEVDDSVDATAKDGFRDGAWLDDEAADDAVKAGEAP